MHVEGYFSDGAPCKSSKIEVYTLEGDKLLEGETNAEGEFSFPLTERRDLRIIMTGSMGHRAETVIKADEMSGGEDEAAPPPAETPPPPRIEESLRKAVQEGMRPLIRMMEEERRRIRMSDIIGGIGYILGIWGTVMFILSRRRQGERSGRP